MKRWCCRIKMSVAGSGYADAEFSWEGGSLPVYGFNIARLFTAIEIRKAAGNKLRNHWKVLKSALLRVTPTWLIIRSDILDMQQHDQTDRGPPLLFFSPGEWRNGSSGHCATPVRKDENSLWRGINTQVWASLQGELISLPLSLPPPPHTTHASHLGN